MRNHISRAYSMAIISISEAAKLTGKNRTTIYNYINNGRLSAVVGVDGTKKIDTTELLRVFPDIKIEESRQQIDNTIQQMETHKTEEINKLKQENQHLKDLLEEKKEQIVIYERTMTLLENKSYTQNKEKKGFWGRIKDAILNE